MITSPIAAAGTCSAAPIRGAAVDTIVPSSISMNMQPATRNPVRRCLASITAAAPGAGRAGTVDGTHVRRQHGRMGAEDPRLVGERRAVG